MGSSEGEAIAAPDVGGAGGCRAYQGGDAGSAIAYAPRFRKNRPVRRREHDLDTVCLIGQGSAALVYLVRCKATGRLSALKVQRKAEHARSAERVHMEREVMVDARHPLVTPLYSAFQDRLYLYLEMEYCPGGSLDNFLMYCVKRNLTESEARFYAAEITLGLEFLHSKGYVYRDLKAANVLVAASGHIKLTDFGIAERGKVRIETDDKVWHDSTSPRPLPRTMSSPSFAEDLPVPATSPASSCVRPRRQTTGSNTAAPGDVPPSEQTGTGTPFRLGKAYHRRTLSAGFGATAVSLSAKQSQVPVTSSPSTREFCSSSFFRRKQAAAPIAGATPPRPPGLGYRMRERFLRSSRGSLSSGSIPCSVLAAAAGSAEGGLRGAAGPRSGGGMPPPSPGRKGMASRDGGGRKQDAKGRGLPPPDRPASPPENCHGMSPTRQTTVTLAEASWGLLSGSPEYMAPEVLMHDPQGSAVDWWGLGILTYELLLGQTPFAGEGGMTRLTFLNIIHKEARFPEPGERGEEGDVSQVCQNFIRGLLAKDPRGRSGSRGAHAVKAHPFFSGVRWGQLLKQEPPLLPQRLGNECGVCPPPVNNTSGWWWAAEDAIAAEAEEARMAGRGGRGGLTSDGNEGETGGWWPFDRFNWSDGAEEKGVRCPVGSTGAESEEQ